MVAGLPRSTVKKSPFFTSRTSAGDPRQQRGAEQRRQQQLQREQQARQANNQNKVSDQISTIKKLNTYASASDKESARIVDRSPSFARVSRPNAPPATVAYFNGVFKEFDPKTNEILTIKQTVDRFTNRGFPQGITEKILSREKIDLTNKEVVDSINSALQRSTPKRSTEEQAAATQKSRLIKEAAPRRAKLLPKQSRGESPKQLLELRNKINKGRKVGDKLTPQGVLVAKRLGLSNSEASQISQTMLRKAAKDLKRKESGFFNEKEKRTFQELVRQDIRTRFIPSLQQKIKDSQKRVTVDQAAAQLRGVTEVSDRVETKFNVERIKERGFFLPKELLTIISLKEEEKQKKFIDSYGAGQSVSYKVGGKVFVLPKLNLSNLRRLKKIIVGETPKLPARVRSAAKRIVTDFRKAPFSYTAKALTSGGEAVFGSAVRTLSSQVTKGISTGKKAAVQVQILEAERRLRNISKKDLTKPKNKIIYDKEVALVKQLYKDFNGLNEVQKQTQKGIGATQDDVIATYVILAFIIGGGLVPRVVSGAVGTIFTGKAVFDVVKAPTARNVGVLATFGVASILAFGVRFKGNSKQAGRVKQAESTLRTQLSKAELGLIKAKPSVIRRAYINTKLMRASLRQRLTRRQLLREKKSIISQLQKDKLANKLTRADKIRLANRLKSLKDVKLTTKISQEKLIRKVLKDKELKKVIRKYEKNPKCGLKGLCEVALKDLATIFVKRGVSTKQLRFVSLQTVSNKGGVSNHVLLKVGKYYVDPTGKQYLFNKKSPSIYTRLPKQYTKVNENFLKLAPPRTKPPKTPKSKKPLKKKVASIKRKAREAGIKLQRASVDRLIKNSKAVQKNIITTKKRILNEMKKVQQARLSGLTARKKQILLQQKRTFSKRLQQLKEQRLKLEKRRSALRKQLKKDSPPGIIKNLEKIKKRELERIEKELARTFVAYREGVEKIPLAQRTKTAKDILKKPKVKDTDKIKFDKKTGQVQILKTVKKTKRIKVKGRTRLKQVRTKQVVKFKPIAQVKRPVTISKTKTKVKVLTVKKQVLTLVIPKPQVSSLKTLLLANLVRQLKSSLTLPVTRLKQVVLPKTIPKLAVRTASRVLSKQKQAQLQRLLSDVRSDVLSLTKYKQLVLQLVSPKLVPRLKQKTKIVTKLKPKIPKIQKIPKKDPTKTFKGFNVYAKKSGRKSKYVKINKAPLTFTQADNLGKYVSDNSRLASYQVRGTSRKAKQKFGTKTSSAKFRLPKKRSKLPSETIVEKRRFRIDTPGEKRDISFSAIRKTTSPEKIRKLLSGKKKKKVTRKVKKRTVSRKKKVKRKPVKRKVTKKQKPKKKATVKRRKKRKK